MFLNCQIHVLYLFSPSLCLSFYFCNGAFWRASVFNLGEIQLIWCFFGVLWLKFMSFLNLCFHIFNQLYNFSVIISINIFLWHKLYTHTHVYTIHTQTYLYPRLHVAILQVTKALFIFYPSFSVSLGFIVDSFNYLVLMFFPLNIFIQWNFHFRYFLTSKKFYFFVSTSICFFFISIYFKSHVKVLIWWLYPLFQVLFPLNRFSLTYSSYVFHFVLSSNFFIFVMTSLKFVVFFQRILNFAPVGN